MGESTFTASKGLEHWTPEVWAVLIEPKPVRGSTQVEMHPASIEYCLRNGVIGLGWDIGQPGKNFKTTDEYHDEARQLHGQDKLTSPETFERIKPGDLVWFAAKAEKPLEYPSGANNYAAGTLTKTYLYLALVVGPWEYRHTPLGWLVDIVSVVPGLIKHVGEIRKTKKGTSTMQPTSSLRLENEQDVKDEILRLWDGYLTKPRTVKPIHKLGDEFVSISKELWAALVKGASPGFRDIPLLPDFKE